MFSALIGKQLLRSLTPKCVRISLLLKGKEKENITAQIESFKYTYSHRGVLRCFEMGKDEKVRVHVVMTREMFEKLERLRKEEGKLSVPELIRDVLSEYIKRCERGG